MYNLFCTVCQADGLSAKNKEVYRMKKVLILVLALAMLLGCTAMAEGNLIGYTCMDGTNPFFVTLEGAIREVVEANGDELISLDPQNSNENQISQIEDLISRGIVAIFLNPVDRDGVIAGLDLLKEADIPIFGFDTEVADMSYLVSYAGSDNYNAGLRLRRGSGREVPGRRRHHRAGFPDDAVRRGPHRRLPRGSGRACPR